MNNLVADTVENSRRDDGVEANMNIDREEEEEEDQEAHFENQNSFKEYTDSGPIPNKGRKKGMRK